MKKLLSLLICILIISSCASAAQERSLKKLPDADFSVDIPDGWWKPEYTSKFLLTKDGPYLQYVLIQQRPLDKPFRNTKKKIRAGMLPQEAAGIIIDELADLMLIAKNEVEEGFTTMMAEQGYDREKAVELSVYGLTGSLVYKNAAYVSGETIDIKSLPAGTYLVRIEGQRGIWTERLIKY